MNLMYSIGLIMLGMLFGGALATLEAEQRRYDYQGSKEIGCVFKGGDTWSCTIELKIGETE